MAHIIINLSLSAAIGYNFFFNPPEFVVVIAILEPANSMRTDNSCFHCGETSNTSSKYDDKWIVITRKLQSNIHVHIRNNHRPLF